MSNLAPQRYFLPTSGTRIVLPAPECSAEPPWRRSAAASRAALRAAAMARLRPAGVSDEQLDDPAALSEEAPPSLRAVMRALPAPAVDAAPQEALLLWAPLLAGAVVLLLLLGTWAWSTVQRELEITRVALTASERRLAQAEARQSEQGLAVSQRVQRELDELRMQARAELRALGAGAQAAEASRSAQTHARLDAMESEVHRRLDAEQSAVRTAWTAHDTPPDPEGLALKRIFARAREALLYIRTSYRVRLTGSGEEQELTSYGTGFLISPAGVAVTAQHVLYPWRYDRRLLTSESLGLAEVIEDSVSVSVWLADSQVTADGSDAAPYLTGRAYRHDAEHATVRILHTGHPDERTELVMSPLGPTAVTMPRVGNGDLAVFQLIDVGRTFPALSLAPAPRPGVLDAVLVLGFPLSRLQDGRAVPQVSLGRVRRAGGEMLELDAAVHPGNSGGPVLDRQGRVVGMASAILDTPIYGLAMPAEELQTAWRTVRDETAQEQRHLRALGCDPGAVDGIPGARTLEAQRCAAGLAAGL